MIQSAGRGAIDDFMRKTYKICFYNKYYKVIDLDNAINTIDLLPSTQSERKKGKWLISDDLPSICSECGTNWAEDYIESRVSYFTGKIPNFCPNCGSDNRSI